MGLLPTENDKREEKMELSKSEVEVLIKALSQRKEEFKDFIEYLEWICTKAISSDTRERIKLWK